jgi:hypothetical protein
MCNFGLWKMHAFSLRKCIMHRILQYELLSQAMD